MIIKRTDGLVRKHSKVGLEASIQVLRRDERRARKEERNEREMVETSMGIRITEFLKPKGYWGAPLVMP